MRKKYINLFILTQNRNLEKSIGSPKNKNL